MPVSYCKDIYKGSTSEAPQDLVGQDEITPMEVCQAEDVELLANGLCKAKNFLSLIHFHFDLRPMSMVPHLKE